MTRQDDSLGIQGGQDTVKKPGVTQVLFKHGDEATRGFDEEPKVHKAKKNPVSRITKNRTASPVVNYMSHFSLTQNDMC